MMRFAPVLCIFALCFPLAASALQYTDLSPEARVMVPENAGLIIELKDGKTIQGTVAMEDEYKVVMSIKRSASVTQSRTVMKTEIASRRQIDCSAAFGVALLKVNLEPQYSLKEEEYQRRIGLFREFLQKCEGAEAQDAIRDRCRQHAEELVRVQRGEEKVDGEWLTPVKAAIKRFNLYCLKMADLEQVKNKRQVTEKMELMGEPYKRLRGESVRVPPAKVATIALLISQEKKYDEAADKMWEEFRVLRRDAARSLPKLMQSRVPSLLEEGVFDEPIEEVTAFLQFWIDQVVLSEGPAKEVLRGMDFDYIIRMEDKIMDAYRKAGGGKKKGNESVPRSMVYVPGGYMMMGHRGDNPDRDDFPMHIVYVRPFLIDKYEIPNMSYRKFVDHVKKTGDSSNEHPESPPLKKHEAQGWKHTNLSRKYQPVIGVDWFDAYAYAKWKGKRLPTEAEWERAARGMETRIFPWGDSAAGVVVSYAAGRKVIAEEMDRQNPPETQVPEQGGCGCFKKTPEKAPAPEKTTIAIETWAVNKSLPREAVEARTNGMLEWDKKYLSPYGLYHMAGNAAEWVGDWYAKDYYGRSPVRNPQGAEFDAKKHQVNVFRGGSYLSTKADQLTTYLRGVPRRPEEKNGNDADGRPMVGFRCAKSLSIMDESDDPVSDTSAMSFDELMNMVGPSSNQ